MAAFKDEFLNESASAAMTNNLDYGRFSNVATPDPDDEDLLDDDNDLDTDLDDNDTALGDDLDDNDDFDDTDLAVADDDDDDL